MRRVTAVLLMLMSMLAAGAVPAVALPGDPPFGPNTPADGASLPVDAGGIPVTFSCPVYRTYDTGGGFAVFGGPKDYSVVMSRGTALGPDGRLADPVALVQASAVPGQDGQCSALLSAGGADRPQETPGAYAWQVARICTGCDLGYETGPVRALTLVTNVKPAVSAATRAYAGYPFIAKVVADGVPDGTTVTVQRRSAGAWVTAGTGTILRGVGEVTTTLPRKGSATLSARLTVGAQEVVGLGSGVLVAAADAKRTAVRAGAWSGKGGVGFRAVGRTIRSFTAKVPMLCPTPGMVSPFTTQIGTASIARIRLAPDGSFVGAATRSGSAMRVRGRLAGGRSSGGRVELSVGGCSGNAAFSAAR
jgi:hypothetical protein